MDWLTFRKQRRQSGGVNMEAVCGCSCRHGFQLVAEEILLGMLKKIAYLTKVICLLETKYDEAGIVNKRVETIYDDKMQQLISETKNKLANCKVVVLPGFSRRPALVAGRRGTLVSGLRFSGSRETLQGSIENLPQQQKEECSSSSGSVADLVDQLSTLQQTHKDHLQSCEETQKRLQEQQGKLQLELQELQEQKEKAERIAHDFEEQMREMATCLEGVRKSASDRQCEMQSLIEEVKRERQGLEQQMEAMQSACTIQAEELQKKTIALSTIEAAKRNLQQLLENEQLEHRLLQARVAAMEMEKDNRSIQLRGALEEAAAERQQIIDKYEKDLKFFSNCNAEREVQLMDDYEWKLREIEKDYKNKMENEKKRCHEKIRTVTHDLEKTFERERGQLHAEKQTLNHQLADVEERLANRSRLAEVELKQLRSLTQELQTGMKTATSQIDQMRHTESCLREELREEHHHMQDAKMLIAKLQCEICDLKERHERKRHEAENRTKRILDDSKVEIEEFWKNNFSEECSRLQAALEKQYEDEKQQVLEYLQEKKDKDMVQIKSEHENRETELQNKLESAQHLIEEAECKLAENIAARAKAEEVAAELSEQMETKQNELEAVIEQLRQELQESREVQRKLKQELELLQALRLQVADHQSQEESLREQLVQEKQQEIDQLHLKRSCRPVGILSGRSGESRQQADGGECTKLKSANIKTTLGEQQTSATIQRNKSPEATGASQWLTGSINKYSPNTRDSIEEHPVGLFLIDSDACTEEESLDISGISLSSLLSGRATVGDDSDWTQENRTPSLKEDGRCSSASLVQFPDLLQTAVLYNMQQPQLHTTTTQFPNAAEGSEICLAGGPINSEVNDHASHHTDSAVRDYAFLPVPSNQLDMCDPLPGTVPDSETTLCYTSCSANATPVVVRKKKGTVMSGFTNVFRKIGSKMKK